MWIEHLRDPWVLAGFIAMLFAYIVMRLINTKVIYLTRQGYERVVKLLVSCFFSGVGCRSAFFWDSFLYLVYTIQGEAGNRAEDGRRRITEHNYRNDHRKRYDKAANRGKAISQHHS